MMRIFALLLAVLLPLQLAWGAAAVYCQHEKTPQGAAHFGHHQHVHHADQRHTKLPGGTVVGDHDCGYCNASAVAVIPAFVPVSAPTQLMLTRGLPADPQPPSAPESIPERPQWPRLA